MPLSDNDDVIADCRRARDPNPPLDIIAAGIVKWTGYRYEPAVYSSPRTCDHRSCDFTTIYRADYWRHMAEVHNV